ncbi:MAG: glycosyltransferase family 39 protein [Candidatus Roizmanbacteria bacterium]|nr:glycosyltransferase family 39 protein [Candidatus Roizmanbacteria bacterium]
MSIYLPLFFLAIGIVTNIYSFYTGGIFFHTDIARDFLLFDDIVTNHHLALIGPRSGGISGVFHGPAWLYLNIPAFVLGGGNPWVVGTFWLLLVLISMYVVWQVGYLLFGKVTALWAVSLYSLYAITYTRNLFNPFGAVLLFGPFFYFIYKYLQTSRGVLLCIALFLLGMIIQFQIAFGAPILILTLLIVLRHILRSKKYMHIFFFFILLIPLSTYIVFEIRHSFLQTHSVLNYIRAPHDGQLIPWYTFPLDRTKNILESLQLFPYWWANFITVLASYLLLRNKKITRGKNIFLLFSYFFVGYWLITLFYKGTIWQYYFWPFFPVLIVVVVELLRYVPKFQRILFYSILGIGTCFIQFRLLQGAKMQTDASSWIFQEKVAQSLFKDAPNEFGYYVFTPDLFGYSPRYAIMYENKLFPNKRAFAFEKKRITYLVIAPPPSDRLFLDGVWWKNNQVKINKKPTKVFTYKNGFRVEKYVLTQKEQSQNSDPNLIQSLIFR